MSTNSSMGIGNFMIPIMFAILATAITHDIYIGLTIFIIGIIFDLCLLISVIPIFGIFIQYWLVTNHVIPYINSIFMVPPEISWIVNALLFISLVIGAIITILITLGMAMIVLDRKHY